MSENTQSYPPPPGREASPPLPGRPHEAQGFTPPPLEDHERYAPPEAPSSMPARPAHEHQQYYPPPGMSGALPAEAPPSMPPRPVQERQQYYPPPDANQVEIPPPMPHRPAQEQQQYYPPPPPGPPPQQTQQGLPYDPQRQAANPNQAPPYDPQRHAVNPNQYLPPPPKRTTNRYSGEQDIGSPIHYTRDPKKLVAYLIPFPKPRLAEVPPESVPLRFMIYTPPPPPFVDKPPEGHEKEESKMHKVQRKWQEEVREAKTGNAKTMSWKGAKGKATKGINWAMGQTKSSNLEFLNRIGGGQQEQQYDKHADDGVHEEEQTKATVKLEEMVLIYPSSMASTPEEMREEFVNTMMRSKTKAQRDAVIATGLIPVSFGIDVLLTFIWPFGGLVEIDSVWAYSSFRGAKTSRSVTKRLTSTSQSGNHDEDMLHLIFTPSPRLAVLEKYLATRCHNRASDIFPSVGLSPTETEALEAIGWFPSSKGGVERNWEDEQWEISEVKEDLQSVMNKAAREWDKWCRAYEKNPEKALKK